MPKLILASQSPRRHQLLKQLKIDFDIEIASTDEQFDSQLPLNEALLQVAREKAQAVLSRYPTAVILAADTIVVLDDEILGKPESLQDAQRMLQLLSNRTHQVLTGVVILNAEKECAYVCITKVNFHDLSDELIQRYLQNGLAMDKAGAYGIQDGYDLVESIEGSYENVMGLPLEGLEKNLQKFGL